MKKLFILICFWFQANLYAQFTDKQITLITKMNGGLSGPWTVYEVYRNYFNTKNEDPKIKIESLYVELVQFDNEKFNEAWPIKMEFYQLANDSIARAEISSDGFKNEIIKTKSFIIILFYKENGSDYYTDSLPIFLKEIKAWFKKNSDRL